MMRSLELEREPRQSLSFLPQHGRKLKDTMTAAELSLLCCCLVVIPIRSNMKWAAAACLPACCIVHQSLMRWMHSAEKNFKFRRNLFYHCNSVLQSGQNSVHDIIISINKYVFFNVYPITNISFSNHNLTKNWNKSKSNNKSTLLQIFYWMHKRYGRPFQHCVN